ncbi:MAG: DUF4230 domain-containing protein [Polyangiales bacterium]|nr:DUF4230 domain-containing protein [Myxococcales bacterium]MCB9657331.1 DUF4230 domain-containing protein [Sandaracinaceae bacterium]
MPSPDAVADPRDTHPARARNRRSPSWLRFVLVGCSLTVAGSAALCTHRVLRVTEPTPEPPTTVEVLRPTASVVTSLRDLARLESAEAHVERVVDLRDRQSVMFGLVDADDAILLIAAADVVAGVDLGRLTPESVEADPTMGRVRIRLPPAEVFSARLDNQRTYVHTRETDVLATRSQTLETRARQEAERTLQRAAVESGVLRRAEQNAARTIESLVRSLGYTDVQVEFAR